MDIPDAELVCQCLDGEKDAFSKLVHKYQGMVHALAYHLIGNFEDAEDIAQISFTKAYLSLSTLKEKDKFASWLRQITANECRILLRSPSRRVIPTEDIGEIQEQMTAEAPDVRLEKVERKDAVREAVSRLPADYRLCVVLFYLGGLSYHEISTFMNISLSTVKWRLHRAKKMLKEMMTMTEKTFSEQKLSEEFADTAVEEAIRNDVLFQWDEAMRKHLTLVEQDAQAWISHIELGRIYYRRGLYDRAIEHLGCVTQAGQFWHPWTYVVLGWCYDAKGERERAIEQYTKATQGMLTASSAEAAIRGLERPHPPKKKLEAPKIEDKPIPTTGWNATASHNAEYAHKAFDRNPSSRWTTRAHQQPGMYFQLDMGLSFSVSRIVLDDDGNGTSIYLCDYPRRYQVEISVDGSNWDEVASGTGDMDAYVCVNLPPAKMRYIKITQTGYCMPEWWSIYDIHVYMPVKA